MSDPDIVPIEDDLDIYESLLMIRNQYLTPAKQLLASDDPVDHLLSTENCMAAEKINDIIIDFYGGT